MFNFGPEKKPEETGQDQGADRPASRAARDAINAWESEGGRSATPPPTQPEAAPPESETVEEVRTELMAQESPDGRPPPVGMRRLEWGALAVATVGALLAAWGLLVMQPRSGPWLIAWGLVLLVTVPVWGAALLRGREGRRATREAQTVVKDREVRATPGREATGNSDRDRNDRPSGDSGKSQHPGR